MKQWPTACMVVIFCLAGLVPSVAGQNDRVDQLIRELNGNESVIAKMRVIQELGKTKDPRIVDPLIAQLRDGNAAIRTVSVQSLGEIVDPRTTEPLIAVLKNDTSDNVRVLAALALCTDKDARAIDPLVVSVKDKFANLRLLSALALGNYKDQRAIDALTAALQDSDDRVRQQAEESLKKIKTEQLQGQGSPVVPTH
ncbi:MAG: HEAT repeat domain-containing protein [Terracidiphilus sp.]